MNKLIPSRCHNKSSNPGGLNNRNTPSVSSGGPGSVWDQGGSGTVLAPGVPGRICPLSLLASGSSDVLGFGHNAAASDPRPRASPLLLGLPLCISYEDVQEDLICRPFTWAHLQTAFSQLRSQSQVWEQRHGHIFLEAITSLPHKPKYFLKLGIFITLNHNI